MNDLEIKQAIRNILRCHQGRSNPITRAELLRQLNLPVGADRKVRVFIGLLRRDYFPILFATEKPYGYYLPATEQERQCGMAKLKSYIRDECIVLAALKIGGARYLENGRQGSLL